MYNLYLSKNCLLDHFKTNKTYYQNLLTKLTNKTYQQNLLIGRPGRLGRPSQFVSSWQVTEVGIEKYLCIMVLCMWVCAG